MVSEEFIQKRQQWLSHFDYKFPIKQNEWCVDTCFYGIMPLRTWVRMSQNKLSEDSTLVVLHYSWQEDYYNSIVDYRARNVTYTLKQECGLDSALGRHINEKSYLAWAGLDLLNIGLASLYAHYDNPYLKSNIFINCGLILCDAALTVGLFLPNKPVRTGCLVGWSIYKVCGIMFCLPIHEHNKLAKTEYKFIFP
jgi:hypothetical protein